MGYLILLVIILLCIKYFIKDIFVPSIIGGIILAIFIIWRIRKSQSSAMDTAEMQKYEKIEMRPLVKNTYNTSNISKTTTNHTATYSKNYETIHRPKDTFRDNMNYKMYKGKGIYIQTNRKRSVTIEAFSDHDAREQMRQSGLIEPYEIERIPFPQVTDAQKEALGNIYLTDVCKYDASAILSCKYDKDSIPNPELVKYATECRIKLSYYIGKKALYDLIFSSLDLNDKIAFFCFCVYRFTTTDRTGNLNYHPYRDLFYKFSEENISDERFVKSMNKYEGNELRYFGNFTINGQVLQGGSTKTIAYKMAIEFLSKKFSLSNVSSKSI